MLHFVLVTCCARQRSAWSPRGAELGKSRRFIVVVQVDDIIIGLSGFYAVYYKPSSQPQLILRRRSETDDNELLAQAMAGRQR